MRNLCKTILSATDTVTRTSDTINSNQLVSASFHISFSDENFGGSARVQVSNDPVANLPNSPGTPSNWVDLPTITASITSGSPAILVVPNMTFQYIRVVVTQTTPGTGVMTVNMNALSL